MFASRDRYKIIDGKLVILLQHDFDGKCSFKFHFLIIKCDGGVALVVCGYEVFARNTRDWGSIPHWGTEFFGPSEPTVTFGAQ